MSNDYVVKRAAIVFMDSPERGDSTAAAFLVLDPPPPEGYDVTQSKQPAVVSAYNLLCAVSELYAEKEAEKETKNTELEGTLYPFGKGMRGLQ